MNLKNLKISVNFERDILFKTNKYNRLKKAIYNAHDAIQAIMKQYYTTPKFSNRCILTKWLGTPKLAYVLRSRDAATTETEDAAMAAEAIQGLNVRPKDENTPVGE